MYTIQSPIDLQKETLIELSFSNPPENPVVPSRRNVGECRVGSIDTSANSFGINCRDVLSGMTPVEATILTYIITNPSAQPSVIETIPGLSDARDLAYDPVHQRMYVTGGNSGNVYVIDVNTNTQISGSPINIGGSPYRIAYDPEHETMYVTDDGGSGPATEIYVINTNNIMEMPVNIPIGESSAGIAYNPDNQMMYIVANGNTVKIIDTDNNMVNPVSIPLTLGPGSSGGIAYDPDHQRMYVTRGSIVDIIDTTTNTLDVIHGPVTVGQNALFGIAYDPVHQTMYVSNTASDDVSVINTDTGMNPNEVIATISGITHAQGLAYDPVNEEMYVTEFLALQVPGSNVRVIDTNTNALVGDPILVGSLPEGLSYEPVHGRMYVANFGSDSVSVIQTPQST